MKKPVKSDVYAKYWQFASLRFDVFQKRLYDRNGPWTNDLVIQNHRFTNVYRASDRVSQYLIRLQNLERDPMEIFFKTFIFKIFNKIETYSHLENELGDVNYKSFQFKRYDELLTKRMAEHKTIYSAAYIMPSAGNVFGYKMKHTNHLALLDRMMKNKLPHRIQSAKSLEEVYKIIISNPSFGSFLAFQYSIDLNYSGLLNFSEMDFVVAGPGAKNGILKCFKALGDYSYEDVIRLMADEQERECERIEVAVPSLWGRRLQLIDCQNIFCEADKYLRVTNPEVSGFSGRTRIKQKYTAIAKEPIDFFFPPKWNINSKINIQCQNKIEEGICS